MVYDKIKEHKCLECNYAATLRQSLSAYVKAVHEKIGEHKCSEGNKTDLQVHVI
jgi:hypothetical protein